MSKPRILVIEDQVQDLLPVKVILEEMGYDVEFGFDGLAAVENLVKKKYDLLILDWSMPDFNGGEALALAQRYIEDPEIKSLYGSQNVQLPYIIYSGTEKEKIDLPKTEKFYCVEHWHKPMNFVEMAKSIKEVLAA